MRVPPVPSETRARSRISGRAILVVLAAVVVALIISARQLAIFYTDKLWFSDLGFGDAWRTLITARVVPSLIFFVITFVLVFASLVVADRLAPKTRTLGPEDEIVERYRMYVAPYAGRVRAAVAFVFAGFAAIGAWGGWQQWVLYQNAVTWGQKDPQFHKDIGYYVFRLPFLRSAIGWVFVVLVMLFFVTAIFHYLNGGIRFQAPHQRVTPQVKAHLSVILASVALVKAVQYWFDRFELVFSQRGAVDGATYTDVHAQLPALNFLVMISIVAAALFLVNIWRRGWTLPVIAVGLWAFIAVVLGTAYPAYVQKFTVEPNQQSREAQYIARNITATRAAFGLNDIKTATYDASTNLSAAAVAQPGNADTMRNARLWDPAQIRDVFKASQSFASFYTINDVDVDRYTVGSENHQQVMVATRDLNLAGLPNDTWTNRHLVYTHGLGVVSAAANAVNGDAPNYLTKNIPQPKVPAELALDRPEVYFSDGFGDFALVDSKEKEAQLANTGDARTTVRYAGKRGVEVNSFVRKAALAMRFGDMNLLLSNRITDQTRLLWVRDVRARVAKAAPFLRFNNDPYPVITNDHRLVWVIDGFTSTNRYPYSQEVRGDDVDINTAAGIGSGYNYLRNSVKATVDAYDGTVHFYGIDDKDPMLRAYRKAFPGLFTERSKMPDGLGAHFRYPEQLLQVQSRVFELYRITNPQDFYQGIGQWAVSSHPPNQLGAATDATSNTATTAASGGSDGGRQARLRPFTDRMPPLYLTMQLPDSAHQEMTLMEPFVPVSRNGGLSNNLAGFLVARNDGFDAKSDGDYGKLIAYATNNNSVRSPEAAARLIESDTTISQYFTLLRGQGSNLRLGDVQLLPVGGSILYLRPVYTLAQDSGSFPTFKGVVLAYGDKAVKADSVSKALVALFGESTGTNPGGGTTTPKTSAEILAAIDKAFQAYETDVAAGKFTDAGKQLDTINQLLVQYRASTAAGAKGGGTTATTQPPTSTPTTAAKPTGTTTTTTVST